MNQHPLLVENEKRRLTIRLPLLLCFSLYNAWQMGVVYFSGNTLSIGGRTPLPIHIDNITVMIAAGYILSIAFMIVLPRFIVWAERISVGIALMSALSLFLPLPPAMLAFLYYIQCFCCIFMIGLETAIIVNLFTDTTALKHTTIAYALSNIIVASLHNELFKVPFSVFLWFTVISLFLMLLFFCTLPTQKEAWPRYLKKKDGIPAPKTLLAGIPIFVGLNCFANLFGTAVAESVPHGVSVIYISAMACGVIVFLLWKWVGIAPLQSCSVLVLFTAMGFVAAIAAQFIPVFSLPACALIGAGITVCWLNPFLGVLIAKRYPSRYTAPAIVGTAFFAVLIHTVLLEALRNNLTVLYVVYLVIAVGMALLYLKLEPYLMYSFRGRTLRDIIGVVAEEADAEIGALDPKAIPIAVSAVEQTPELEDTPLNVRRMQNLTRLSITPLTSREYQVADLIMQGMKRQEIADTLNIKPDTISKHRNAIYSKFGIHRRQELFAIADRLDLELAEEGGGEE